MDTILALIPPQNKYFRSWARKLRKSKKVDSAHEREGVEEERDRYRVVLKSENYIYFEINFES